MRAALLALILAGPALAQAQPQGRPMPTPSQAACPAAAPKLAPEMAGWNAAPPTDAVVDEALPSGATLPLGRAVHVALRSNTAAFAPPPEHAPAPGTDSGQFTFSVPAAGRYRIALGSAVWVDVVRNGQTMPTSAHGHGPDCTGIRKMVDYRLQPGQYVLQVSGSVTTGTRLMVARLPG